MKRNHQITVAEDGLITVVGGKLTTSRHMAEQTIDAASKLLGKKKRCTTKSAYLLGAAGYDPQAVMASGGMAAHLGERYGTEAHFVSDILQQDPTLAKPIVEGLPYSEAEVLYAIRHELASTVDDVLARRIRARLMARDASAQAAQRVGELLQQELSFTAEEIKTQVDDYQAAIKREKSILIGEAI
ncbi:glycerol-3-phosphate dehydrogenase C-terminal domain-containing protein [Providencia manganoxydans]